ncbi:40S ribosomal protein S16 [Pseudoloma neurophilia]|uniref:40S ribosomal protein S16 n=1 Tax=Pseudoloma neurophilia TaxID=146866 RepID=A0A0R0M5D7_9MICR|nr:40S ribosomal protein S16 [Pseudoloma neurophilia]
MLQVQTLGSKKTAKACAITNKSNTDFSLVVNCINYNMIQDGFLRDKLKELICIIGEENLENISVNVRVRGGGHISQAYAIRQAIAKGVVAYYGKYIDEEKKQELQNKLLSFDKFTLIADPRKMEAKKYGGPSARAKYTKSYR